MRKKISTVTYAVVFILVTAVLGFFSFTNLAKFYVNGEVDYIEWTADLGSRFETDIATTFVDKYAFISMNGAVRKLLGQREMNKTVKINNGHLIEPEPRKTDAEVKTAADEVIRYADFCREQGKPFLFVQPILKVDRDNKQLPAGIEDYSNENADAFLDYLREAGIEIIDIRDCMKEDGLDMYDYTYVTDHHWTTIGSFYSFTKIADWIEEKTGVAAAPEVVDINQYERVTYPQWHLGTYGQRTGPAFAGVDDYDFLIPAFDVAFVDDSGASHSFREQVIDESVFETRDLKNRYTYDCALMYPEGFSTAGKELSVFFVTDSYVAGMVPYLKLAYSDFAYQWYFDGFVSDFVLQVDPDVIVMMPYMTNVFNPDAVFIESKILGK